MWLERNLVTDSQHDDAVLGVAVRQTSIITDIITSLDRQNLFCVLFGFHLLAGKDLFDDTLFVDDKGGADGTHGLFAIHVLFAPCTHGF